MKRLIYIISALLFVACTGNLSNLEEPDVMRSQMAPVACIDAVGLPPGATKALVDASTAVSMEANVLRIDEGSATSWSQAYLAEADVASASTSGLRTMFLNPVQAYNDEGTSRLVSWYPRTCSLHKDEEGNAVTIKLADFQVNRQEQVYTETDGSFRLNFSGLDGSKDIMVSNVVEGTKSEPFGSQKPMTYTHYMSAVKVYAYVHESSQDVSMWGALRKVVVKNQPSEVSVSLPSPSSAAAEAAADDAGNPTFSGKVDFPLIKTAMFGDADQNPEIAPDAPVLDVSNKQDNPIYLGYALIQPNGNGSQNLELDIHTDSGMISVDVPMSTGEGVSKVDYFKAGYIYTVNICFNTENAIAAVVLKSGEEHYYDLSSGKELDGGIYSQRNANCYIIHPGIKRTDSNSNNVPYDGYSFNVTVVGNGEQGLYANSSFDRTTTEIDPVRAGLLWESSQGLVKQVELLYGYVRFKAADPDTQEGNAVIAVYDSQRRVLWSWHIWITDTPQDVTYSNGVVLLDRNLGATAATVSEGNLLETYGLYYQWGRKDPSMGPKVTPYLPQSTETATYYDYYGDPWNYTGVVTLARPTVRDGVENPMYLMMPSDFSMTTYQYDWLYTNIDNLWGDYDHSTEGNHRRQKTIYDPCPFGYMVPQDEITTLFSSVNQYSNPTDGFTITGNVVDDDKGTSDESDDTFKSYSSFFPFAGYKGVDKGVSSLTGAWKYVGEKGDYMSSKIDRNGHRSRTYISKASSWTEYGADNDNDGDGDASRTYSSRIYADDMANRRTAASIRCVKRDHALNSSIIANLTSDKKFVFVGDPDVTFSYDIEAYGGSATIASAIVDVFENEAETPTQVCTLEVAENTSVNGTFKVELPKTAGLYRYRLVSTSSNDVTSRVSYALRVFEIQGIQINDAYFYENAATFDYGTKYKVSFTLKGVETDFSVYVNGVKATKSTVTTVGGVASMPFSVDAVYIPGHLHIQILDAAGSLAYEKTYHVNMNSLGSSTLTLGDEVTDASQLEAGALYVIRTYAKYNNNYHYLNYNDGVLAVESLADNNPAVDINNVFLYHRDDTKIVSTSYSHVSAGALFNMSADAATSQQLDDGFVKSNFSFGPESEAIYATIANNYTNNNNRFTAIYWGDNIRYLSISNQGTLETTTRARGDNYKWVIYKVNVIPQNNDDGGGAFEIDLDEFCFSGETATVSCTGIDNPENVIIQYVVSDSEPGSNAVWNTVSVSEYQQVESKYYFEFTVPVLSSGITQTKLWVRLVEDTKYSEVESTYIYDLATPDLLFVIRLDDRDDTSNYKALTLSGEDITMTDYDVQSEGQIFQISWSNTDNIDSTQYSECKLVTIKAKENTYLWANYDVLATSYFPNTEFYFCKMKNDDSYEIRVRDRLYNDQYLQSGTDDDAPTIGDISKDKIHSWKLIPVQQ